jgi:hypothetical protein
MFRIFVPQMHFEPPYSLIDYIFIERAACIQFVFGCRNAVSEDYVLYALILDFRAGIAMLASSFHVYSYE